MLGRVYAVRRPGQRFIFFVMFVSCVVRPIVLCVTGRACAVCRQTSSVVSRFCLVLPSYARLRARYIYPLGSGTADAAAVCLSDHFPPTRGTDTAYREPCRLSYGSMAPASVVPRFSDCGSSGQALAPHETPQGLFRPSASGPGTLIFLAGVGASRSVPSATLLSRNASHSLCDTITAPIFRTNPHACW